MILLNRSVHEKNVNKTWTILQRDKDQYTPWISNVRKLNSKTSWSEQGINNVYNETSWSNSRLPSRHELYKKIFPSIFFSPLFRLFIHLCRHVIKLCADDTALSTGDSKLATWKRMNKIPYNKTTLDEVEYRT